MEKTATEWALYDIPTYQRRELTPKVNIGISYMKPTPKANTHTTVSFCELTAEADRKGRQDAWVIFALFVLVYIVATVGAK